VYHATSLSVIFIIYNSKKCVLNDENWGYEKCAN
jgi:hypothetical protein